MLNDMFYRLENVHITRQQIKFSILTHLSLVLTWAMIAQGDKMYQRWSLCPVVMNTRLCVSFNLEQNMCPQIVKSNSMLL